MSIYHCHQLKVISYIMTITSPVNIACLELKTKVRPLDSLIISRHYGNETFCHLANMNVDVHSLAEICGTLRQIMSLRRQTYCGLSKKRTHLKSL